MNIFEKLSEIQIELKTPKNQFNSFGKYHYRSCEDIMEGVKPLLFKNKTTLTVCDEVVMIGERYYVEATATLTDAETTEEIRVTAFAREEESKKGMDGSQVTGASSSYARKYALNGLFAIDDTKDADSTNTHEKAPTKPVSNYKPQTTNTTIKAEAPLEKPVSSENGQVISAAQLKRLYSLAGGKEHADTAKAIMAGYNYSSAKEILTKDYEKVCSDIANAVKGA